MAKEELMRFEGKVIDVLPNATFKVEIDGNSHIVLAHLGGKLRKHIINISLGDKVSIEVSPYDLSRGRIVYRN